MITFSATRDMDLSQGDTLLLKEGEPLPCQGSDLLLSYSSLPNLPVGSFLGTDYSSASFQILMRTWLPEDQTISQKGYWLRALSSSRLDKRPLAYHVWQGGWSLAWITLSDKGAQGERPDRSGPIIPELVRESLPVSIHRGFLIPDNKNELKGVLSNLVFEQQFDLICTTGGTGVTSSDITPEATTSLIERRLPGFEQTMISASLQQTPHGMISRAVVGIASKSMIINLPGSPKAVKENLSAVLPALKHTLDKIHDDPGECASVPS